MRVEPVHGLDLNGDMRGDPGGHRLPRLDPRWGGGSEVENLDNGERPRGGRSAKRAASGWPVPSDAARTAVEKGILVGGARATGPGARTPSTRVADNAGLGDRFDLVLRDASGQEVAHLDSFQEEVVFEGVTYPSGSPLVAPARGSGHIRSSSRFRRLVQTLALATESGDPIAYAPRWFTDPFAGEAPRNVLMMPTVGDDVVPIATGIALARAAGLYDPVAIDPRYGMSVDHWLGQAGVIHGLEEHGPWRDSAGEPILFDPDDLDEGADGLDAPSDTPLRATVETASGVSGMRIIYGDPRGSHGWDFEPINGWDVGSFATMQAAWYLASGGQEISDDPCLASLSCPFFDP